MGTNIYTTDGDWVNTPASYNQVKDLLLENKPYIEVPGAKGNNYLIKVSNITCVEQKLSKHEEEKQ